MDNNPWGNFRSTYQLPDKITRRFGEEYNECLLRRDKWRNYPQKARKPCEDSNNNVATNKNLIDITVELPNCKTKCENTERILSAARDTTHLLGKCEKPQKVMQYNIIN